ncbi:hypothetical protein LCGC14_2747470, partial [marine sediment metagenome]
MLADKLALMKEEMMAETDREFVEELMKMGMDISERLDGPPLFGATVKALRRLKKGKLIARIMKIEGWLLMARTSAAAADRKAQGARREAGGGVPQGRPQEVLGAPVGRGATQGGLRAGHGRGAPDGARGAD